MSKPLEGIRVVELSTFVAAPVSARLLADMGAEVIKLETAAGDGWRKAGLSYCPGRFTPEENPVFDVYNSGKKGLSLNLKTPEGMEAMYKLLATADVFVTNNRPAALNRLGLGYEQLKEKFPRLIYGIVLGYGENGPDGQMPAYDTSAFWSRSGFIRDMAVAGENYHPVMPPFGMGDTFTGTVLTMQIGTALYHREKTGKGQLVRSGLFHNGIFSVATMVLQTQRPFGKTFPSRRQDFNVPGGAYPCADGEWVYFSVGDASKTIPALHNMLGRPDLTTDPRFLPTTRANNREPYYYILREEFLKDTADNWAKKAKEFDVPVMKLQHFADVSEDEQAWANDYLEHIEYPNGHVDVMPTSPVEMESVGKVVTTPSPKVGQDTRSILADLGYSDAQIDAMLAAGAAVENK